MARKEPEVRDEEEEEDGDESMSEDSSEEDSEEEEDDILLRTSLDLSSKPLPPLEQLSSTLAKFKNLSSLNISAMQPSKAAGNSRGLVHLRWLGRAVKVAGEGGFGSRLTQLNMSENGSFGREEAKDEAGKWDGLQRLTKLMGECRSLSSKVKRMRKSRMHTDFRLRTVLNASACELRHFPPAPILLPLTSLTALVLSNNALTSLPTLPHLPHLNTLILSKNRLRALPASLASSAPALKKLAASHNVLDFAPTALPDLSACAHLRQVRLHCNPSLRRLPRHLSTWGRGVGQGARGTGIELLDLSECGLDGWASVEDALLNAPMAGAAGEEQGGRRERGLTNLSLKGNGLAELKGYRQRLLGHFRTLKILDNESVVERRKKKKRNGTSAAEEGRSDRERAEDERGDRARDASDSSMADPPPSPHAAESSTSAPKLPREKKREAAAAAARGRRDADEETTEEGSIQRKNANRKTRRGARGKKKHGTEADTGDEPGKAPLVEAPSDKGGSVLKKKKEKVGREDEEMRRLQARAGPPPPAEEDEGETNRAGSKGGPKATKKEKKGDKGKMVGAEQRPKSAKEELEAKKKRAWDAINEGLGASSSSAQKATMDKTVEGQGDDEGDRGARKRQVDASAVAGIVHVKKKRKQHAATPDQSEARNSPAKTADPFAQVGLGLGGAWD